MADPDHPFSLSADDDSSDSGYHQPHQNDEENYQETQEDGQNCQQPQEDYQQSQENGDQESGEVIPTTPAIGMYFETEDDAYEFYKSYAATLGFVVRKSNKSKNSRHRVTRRLFVCSKQGYRQDKKGEEGVITTTTPPPRCPDSRTGCIASLTIKLVSSGNAFKVTDFIPEHNHQLARAPAVSVLGPLTLSVDAPDPRDGPRHDMHFETEEDAYAFYNRYAEHVGFSVRRSYKKRKRGVIVSRIFVCSREGVSDRAKQHQQGNDAIVVVAGNANVGASSGPRPGPPPTRTGCQARMVIKITPCRTYRVAKFFAEHNHPLANPDSVHKLRSHKMKAKALELGSPEYHSRKRAKGVQLGDAGAALEYLQSLQLDSPSVYYAVGMGPDGKAASNFFWADAKSVVDFRSFGDVVCFDTTYGLNGYGRPFALFVGVDNHKQLLVFGAALLYDDGAASLRWVFEAFNDAMRDRQPETVLTDERPEFASAVAAVWPNSVQQTSVWHIYHNAKKHIKQVFENPKSFANALGHCLFECEEEQEFLSEWEKLLEKHDVGENEWLTGLFKEKERWALPYGKHVFTADMLTTLRKENMINEIKRELSEQEDILQFFRRYENVLEEHRSKKMQTEVDASQVPLPIPSLRILKQTSSLYTPEAFKTFQSEFEAYMNCMSYHCGVVGMVSDYKITVDERPHEYTVSYDAVDGSVTCSCKKFENVGIQCCHVLKVLDLKNIKELPPHCILKRWTKDARSGRVGSYPAYESGTAVRTALEVRYSSLCRIASIIAARAAKSDEAIAFVEDQSSALMKHLDQILQTGFPEIANHASTSNPFVSQLTSNNLQGSAIAHTTNGLIGV